MQRARTAQQALGREVQVSIADVLGGFLVVQSGLLLAIGRLWGVASLLFGALLLYPRLSIALYLLNADLGRRFRGRAEQSDAADSYEDWLQSVTIELKSRSQGWTPGAETTLADALGEAATVSRVRHVRVSELTAFDALARASGMTLQHLLEDVARGKIVEVVELDGIRYDVDTAFVGALIGVAEESRLDGIDIDRLVREVEQFALTPVSGLEDSTPSAAKHSGSTVNHATSV